MRKVAITLAILIMALQLSNPVWGDVSAQVKWAFGAGTTLAGLKVEVLQNAAVFDVTVLYAPCGGTSYCAVVAQPTTAGSYNYSVRITDLLGRSATSNVVILQVPPPPAPASCQSVNLVTTTGTPTPAPTATP